MRRFNIIKYSCLGFLCLLIVGIISYYGYNYFQKLRDENKKVGVNQDVLNDLVKEDEVPIKDKEPSIDETDMVMVDLKGFVANPNIYKVHKDARVIDVINMAGGLLNESDTSMLNLSKKVSDEMVIIIYSRDEVNNYLETKRNEQIKQELCQKEELTNDACLTVNEGQEVKLININTASLIELTTLPSIGESKAQDIITYREANGLFKSIEDLKQVPGIGESIFAKIKDYITI